MLFNFNLRFYLVTGLMLYSTSAWPDKNLLEVAGGECISCNEHDQARAKFNLKAAVFKAKDEGRFIKT
ncbi:MAG: hypothetical protein IPJ25_10085 [Rhodocyclaceae bacterium]|nr:hypothetical protein [Rhodocyclaceae bacterium]